MIVSDDYHPNDKSMKMDKLVLLTKTKRYVMYEDEEGKLYIVALDGMIVLTPSAANKIVIDSV